ncbi:MAG: DMT family transporter [Betaproteobacteria bacterium]|nr:DMT family transporter [Betaproteobacteria bacterium]
MGSAWMLVGGLCFALMSAVVQVAGQWFSGVELVFYRSLVGFVAIAAPMFWRHGGAAAGHLRGDHLASHLRRGLVGFLALSTFFYALIHLPMSVAVTLNYASPLYLALLMPWQLGERPSPAQYAAVAVGFAGVALLLRPWETAPGDLFAGLAGLFSGVMAAIAYVHVRRLGRLHEPEWRTVFWFAVVGTLGGAAVTSVTGWHALHAENLPWLLLLGALATLGQLAMTRAYRTGQTAVVASFAFSTVLFSSILDVLLWGRTLPILAWCGVAVTVASGIWAVRLNNGDKA